MLEVLPDGDFKPKRKYYGKEITWSTKVTTNWWAHLVQRVPQSSAPVERLFSVAGKVFTLERCQLTDKRWGQLILSDARTPQ